MWINAIELFPVFNLVGTIQWTAGAAREISDRWSYTPGIEIFKVYLISMSHVARSYFSECVKLNRDSELRIYVEETEINTVSIPDTFFWIYSTSAFAEILGQMGYLHTISVEFWNRDAPLPNNSSLVLHMPVDQKREGR